MSCGLTDIRERKWGICHFVSERVLVAFGAVLVADGEMITPKALPTKVAFAGAGPPAGRAAVRHAGFHDFYFRPPGRVVENSFHAGGGAGARSEPEPCRRTGVAPVSDFESSP